MVLFSCCLIFKVLLSRKFSREPFYYITFAIVCQALFQTFLNFFVFAVPLARQLIYYIKSTPICQGVFKSFLCFLEVFLIFAIFGIFGLHLVGGRQVSTQDVDLLGFSPVRKNPSCGFSCVLLYSPGAPPPDPRQGFTLYPTSFSKKRKRKVALATFRFLVIFVL